MAESSTQRSPQAGGLHPLRLPALVRSFHPTLPRAHNPTPSSSPSFSETRSCTLDILLALFSTLHIYFSFYQSSPSPCFYPRLFFPRSTLRHPPLMYSVLVLAFLMTLLLQPAAATTPVMAVCLPASPMESFIPYPDPDELLVGICDLCGISLDFCMHAIVGPLAPSTPRLTDTIRHRRRDEPQPSPLTCSLNIPNGRKTSPQCLTSTSHLSRTHSTQRQHHYPL